MPKTMTTHIDLDLDLFDRVRRDFEARHDAGMASAALVRFPLEREELDSGCSPSETPTGPPRRQR